MLYIPEIKKIREKKKKKVLAIKASPKRLTFNTRYYFLLDSMARYKIFNKYTVRPGKNLMFFPPRSHQHPFTPKVGIQLAAFAAYCHTCPHGIL